MVRDQETIKYPGKIQVKPTAAAGSESDLASVKREMDCSNTSVSFAQTTQSSTTQHGTQLTMTSCNSQVLQCLFAVQLWRLTQEEITYHTRRAASTTTKPKKTNPTTKPCTVHLHHLLPRDILDFNTVQTKLHTKNTGPQAPLAMSTTQSRTAERLKSHMKQNLDRPKRNVKKPKKAIN